jgi:ParB family transcriptional regulator, chromosome partitioning protein
MATEEFLSCLSRSALETVARTEGVNIAPRAKDTRERMVARFEEGSFVYPGALFRLTAEEQEAAAGLQRAEAGRGSPEAAEADEGRGDDRTEPEASDEDADGFVHDDRAEREAA